MAERFENLGDYRPREERAPDGVDFDEWWASLSTTEQRLEVIVDFMSQGRWLSGVTDKALAHDWNLNPATVRRLAAEASRTLKRYAVDSPEQREAVKQQILHTFEVIRAKAMQNGDSGSLRVALEATRTFGFWLGLEPVRRMQVSETSTEDELDHMSDEELERFAIGRRRRSRRSLPRANGDATNGEAPPEGGDGEPPVH